MKNNKNEIPLRNLKTSNEQTSNLMKVKCIDFNHNSFKKHFKPLEKTVFSINFLSFFIRTNATLVSAISVAPAKPCRPFVDRRWSCPSKSSPRRFSPTSARSCSGWTRCCCWLWAVRRLWPTVGGWLVRVWAVVLSGLECEYSLLL